MKPLEVVTKHNLSITDKNKRFFLSISENHKKYNKLTDSASVIPQAKWNPHDHGWDISNDRSSCLGLLSFIKENQYKCPAGLVENIKELLVDYEYRINLSNAKDADFDVKGINGELFPFQRAGVAYACWSKRTFIADDMGLGKTIEALATIEHEQAFPALIAVPASVKLGWAKKIKQFFPHRSIEVVNGTGKPVARSINTLFDYGIDIFIINYDIISDHEILKALQRNQWKAIILDESHNIKNGQAQRTKAIKTLTDGVDIRLCLTGTPTLNRPSELISQLDFLGRLHEFGGKDGFIKRYCAGDPSGASNLDELNEKLRTTCFVRRLKPDVWAQMPEKLREPITVPITNRAEYNAEERSMKSWLARQIARANAVKKDVAGKEYADEVIAAMDKKTKLQALAMMNKLKKLSAIGKIKAAKEWINDFLKSDQKIVIFAYHIDVQERLVKAYPGCAHLLGSDSLVERERQKQRFINDPKCRVAVLSLSAAGTGVDELQEASSNVFFIEQGWTPGQLDQAEDRLHRIGQDDTVNAWYMHGENTIDQKMSILIEKKRAVNRAVSDGGKHVDVSLEMELVAELLRAA